MKRNVEIKASITPFDAIEMPKRAAAHPDFVPLHPSQAIIVQHDIFYGRLSDSSHRLKLRQFPDNRGQLIWYNRPNDLTPKLSQYCMAAVPNASEMDRVLRLAYGEPIGEVHNHRFLFMIGQTRVHMDTVEGLGFFVELEVQLEPHESEAHGRAIADELIRYLGIDRDKLLRVAYIDLIQSRGNTA